MGMMKCKHAETSYSLVVYTVIHPQMHFELGGSQKKGISWHHSECIWGCVCKYADLVLIHMQLMQIIVSLLLHLENACSPCIRKLLPGRVFIYFHVHSSGISLEVNKCMCLLHFHIDIYTHIYIYIYIIYLNLRLYHIFCLHLISKSAHIFVYFKSNKTYPIEVTYSSLWLPCL